MCMEALANKMFLLETNNKQQSSPLLSQKLTQLRYHLSRLLLKNLFFEKTAKSLTDILR